MLKIVEQHEGRMLISGDPNAFCDVAEIVVWPEMFRIGRTAIRFKNNTHFLDDVIGLASSSGPISLQIVDLSGSAPATGLGKVAGEELRALGAVIGDLKRDSLVRWALLPHLLQKSSIMGQDNHLGAGEPGLFDLVDCLPTPIGILARKWVVEHDYAAGTIWIAFEMGKKEGKGEGRPIACA